MSDLTLPPDYPRALRGAAVSGQAADGVHDPVEAQVQELIGRIPGVLSEAQSSLTIQGLANALGHHTNAPWCVAVAVVRLETQGVIRRDRSRGDRTPWRWLLTAPAPTGSEEGAR